MYESVCRRHDWHLFEPDVFYCTTNWSTYQLSSKAEPRNVLKHVSIIITTMTWWPDLKIAYCVDLLLKQKAALTFELVLYCTAIRMPFIFSYTSLTLASITFPELFLSCHETYLCVIPWCYYFSGPLLQSPFLKYSYLMTHETYYICLWYHAVFDQFDMLATQKKKNIFSY